MKNIEALTPLQLWLIKHDWEKVDTIEFDEHARNGEFKIGPYVESVKNETVDEETLVEGWEKTKDNIGTCSNYLWRKAAWGVLKDKDGARGRKIRSYVYS